VILPSSTFTFCRFPFICLTDVAKAIAICSSSAAASGLYAVVLRDM